MNISPFVEDAIEEAVKNNKQDSRVAKKLAKWIEEMQSRELTREEKANFLNVVLDAIKFE